jgi:methanogenic corrinoid protein MtbC1
MTTIMSDELTNLLTLGDNIVNLKEQEVLTDLEKLLEAGVPPWDIMNCFNESLRRVGQMFQAGTYFMTGLVMAGEIMRQAMEVLMPHLAHVRQPRKSGLIIIGTIEGDIHDLGKNMAAWFLEADGFEVVDLGVDVPPRVFLREILQREPDAVGVSLLLTSCVETVKRLVKLIKDAYNDRPNPPIFVGCGFLSTTTENPLLTGQTDSARPNFEKQWLEVDHLVNDAYDTLRLCRELVSRKAGKITSKITSQITS